MFAVLANPNIEEDSIFGLHLATFTGALDDTGNYVEVVFGEQLTQMVKMLNAFPISAVISKKWLDAHKDKVFGIVAFEKAMPEKGFLIGITYRDNIERTPTLVELLSEKSSITLDDDKELIEVITKEFKAVSSKVYLGKDAGDSDQLVRYNEIKDVLENLYGLIEDIYTRLNATPVAGNGVPFDPTILAIQKPKIELAKKKIAKIKTDKTFAV